jgi:hypothetical protein
MAFKTRFKAGDRVECYRTHDKSTKLTGTIVGQAEGDADQVLVKTDAANGSVSRIEQVDARDVTPIEAPAAAAAKPAAAAATTSNGADDGKPATT